MIPDARISDLRRAAVDASIFMEIKAYRYIAAVKFIEQLLDYIYTKIALTHNPATLESPLDEIVYTLMKNKNLELDKLVKHIEKLLDIARRIFEGKISDAEAKELLEFIQVVAQVAMSLELRALLSKP